MASALIFASKPWPAAQRTQVTRIVGVAKDITDQIEASESLRDSEHRYRMGYISDVISLLNNSLQPNHVSPSIETVLGHDADWVPATTGKPPSPNHSN